MIYITDDTTTILVPRVTPGEVSGITFTNQVTHEEVSGEVTDQTPSGFSYKLDISSLISSFRTGQYDYEVTSAAGVKATGIAQFGGFDRTPTAYTQDITIKTYKG